MESFVPADQVSEEDYDRVLDVNTKGVFLLTKAVARVMKAQEPRQVEFPRHGTRDIGRGAIVTISSILSLIAMPDRAHYVTSKHAVLGLVRSVGTLLPPSRLSNENEKKKTKTPSADNRDGRAS